MNRSWSKAIKAKDKGEAKGEEEEDLFVFSIDPSWRRRTTNANGIASSYGGTHQCQNCYVSFETQVPSTPVVIDLFFTRAIPPPQHRIGCLIFFFFNIFFRTRADFLQKYINYTNLKIKSPINQWRVYRTFGTYLPAQPVNKTIVFEIILKTWIFQTETFPAKRTYVVLHYFTFFKISFFGCSASKV